MGDPVAFAPVEPAFADGELDVLEPLDEHALTDATTASAAATTAKILRLRTMTGFLPPLSAAAADHDMNVAAVTCSSPAGRAKHSKQSLRRNIVNNHSLDASSDVTISQQDRNRPR